MHPGLARRVEAFHHYAPLGPHLLQPQIKNVIKALHGTIVIFPYLRTACIKTSLETLWLFLLLCNSWVKNSMAKHACSSLVPGITSAQKGAWTGTLHSKIKRGVLTASGHLPQARVTDTPVLSSREWNQTQLNNNHTYRNTHFRGVWYFQRIKFFKITSFRENKICL